MTNSSIAEICELLKNADKVAVFCHARPDGDALGAGMALSTALNNAGKFAVTCCDGSVPEKYCFIKEMSEVKDKLPDGVEFDTFISVDCADINRMGTFANAFAQFKGRKINIDHHISNKRFAEFNYVAECPATCEILTEILTLAGFEINGKVADLLMLGLIADSGNFSHKDVTEKTFETGALLRKCGADVNEINYQLFSRQSKMRALLFGKVIDNMRFALDDKLVFIVVGLDLMGQFGADRSITEGFVDYPLTIDGVEVSVSLLEVKKHQYRISLRSKTVNVNAVAGMFGGGGHVLASGCMLTGEYEEVIEKITYAVYQNL